MTKKGKDKGGSYARRSAANDRSLLHAENYRATWSAEEDDLLRETMAEPLEDVAYVLGRSIFAVDLRRSQVRNNQVQAHAAWDRMRPVHRSAEDYGTQCDRCGLVHRGDC